MASKAPSAAVLLPSAALPSASRLERALGGNGRVSSVGADRAVVQSGPVSVTLSLQGAQVAHAAADTAAFLSLSSVRDNWRLPKHGAHLELTMTSSAAVVKEKGLFNRVMGATRAATAVEGLSAFTRVVAAVTEASDALGVYWGAGPVTHQPRFFIDVAKETEVPLPLWVGVTITPDDAGRVQVLSMGMEQLGLPDLLLAAPRTDAADVLDFFFSTLTVAAESGQAFPEGHLVSRSFLERVAVRYVASPIDPAQRVMKLELR